MLPVTQSDHGSDAKASTPSAASRLKVLVIGLAIFLAVFGVVWLQSAKYEPLTVGKAAPNFSLPDLSDKSVQLTDYLGKVVFLNFWATWCKPCQEEMPSMEQLYRAYGKDGLVILAVSIDRVTTKKDIPPFVKSMDLTFPVLVDSWGQTDKRYKLMGVPETYIIGRDGVLREKVIGPRDWTRKENLTVIDELLKSTPTSAIESSLSGAPRG